MLARKMLNQNREKIAPTIGYYALFVGIGLVLASLGPTLPALAQQTGSTLSQIGIIFTVRAVGALFAALLGSRLYDRFPGHPVMAGAILALAVMMGLIPLAPLLWVLIILNFILGFAEITNDVGGNTLLLWVHKDKSAPYMNGLHFFFGVGAFLSPMIVAWAVDFSGGITWAYWILAALLLPVALWLARVPSPARPVISTSETRQATNRLLVALIALFYFLYVGIEISFGGWIFSYATTLNLTDETTAAYLTSAFYGAFTLGRLFSIPMVARFRPRFVVMADLLGALLSIGLMVIWPTSIVVVTVGTIGLGLAAASVFPTVYAMAGRRMVVTGQISGLFFAGASLGGMSVPWLIGQLFEKVRPQAMMSFLWVELVLALAVILLVIKYSDVEK